MTSKEISEESMETTVRHTPLMQMLAPSSTGRRNSGHSSASRAPAALLCSDRTTPMHWTIPVNIPASPAPCDLLASPLYASFRGHAVQEKLSLQSPERKRAG